MKVQEFRLLDDTEKAFVLINEGVLIGKRNLLFYLVFLYQIDGFYVEILYNKKTCQMFKFKAFENTELLNPYLVKIDISWLEELKL